MISKMISLNGLHAVTFDVGGTLITPWPSVGHVYAEVAGRHGYPGLSPEVLDKRFAVAWRSLRGFEQARSQWARLVDATFEGLVELPPSQTFFPVLYERFTQPAAWHVYEDVLPVLKKLKHMGLSLGIISNWDERLRPLLRSLELEHYFEAVAISCEVGASKPARCIFQAAARELKLPEEAILHVGDSQQMDVAGAREAGLRAIWLRRGTGAREKDVIQSLAEL